MIKCIIRLPHKRKPLPVDKLLKLSLLNAVKMEVAAEISLDEDSVNTLGSLRELVFRNQEPRGCVGGEAHNSAFFLGYNLPQPQNSFVYIIGNSL